jgi:sirohydrochlorin cobaltochelatase
MAKSQAIVLFAHGARDAEWARPLERIAQSLAKRRSGAAVRVAYLELMRPSLEEAVAALAAEGAARVTVVPVFLGQGGHVKEDLPKLVAAAQAAHPGVSIEAQPAIGEQPEVIEAIAGAIAARTR